MIAMLSSINKDLKGMIYPTFINGTVNGYFEQRNIRVEYEHLYLRSCNIETEEQEKLLSLYLEAKLQNNPYFKFLFLYHILSFKEKTKEYIKIAERIKAFINEVSYLDNNIKHIGQITLEQQYKKDNTKSIKPYSYNDLITFTC